MVKGFSGEERVFFFFTWFPNLGHERQATCPERYPLLGCLENAQLDVRMSPWNSDDAPKISYGKPRFIPFCPPSTSILPALHIHPMVFFCAPSNIKNTNKWVCLKMGYTPNEIAIFHRDNDQQNHWVFRGLANIFRQTHNSSIGNIGHHLIVAPKPNGY